MSLSRVIMPKSFEFDLILSHLYGLQPTPSSIKSNIINSLRGNSSWQSKTVPASFWNYFRTRWQHQVKARLPHFYGEVSSQPPTFPRRKLNSNSTRFSGSFMEMLLHPTWEIIIRIFTIDLIAQTAISFSVGSSRRGFCGQPLNNFLENKFKKLTEEGEGRKKGGKKKENKPLAIFFLRITTNLLRSY